MTATRDDMQVCFDCGGAGEVYAGREPYFGIVETRRCNLCDGQAELPADVHRCPCGRLYFDGDDCCPHGNNLCGDCRCDCTECSLNTADDHGLDFAVEDMLNEGRS